MGTTDDFTPSFLHFSLFSTALWDLANSGPVHSLMSSSHLFLCLSCLLPPFTVLCKMILARQSVGTYQSLYWSIQLVKNRCLKGAKTRSWSLPFCDWQSVSVMSRTSRHCEALVSFMSQVNLSLFFIGKERTNVGAAWEASIRSEDLLLMHEY